MANIISPFLITEETVGDGADTKKWVLVDENLDTVVGDIILQTASSNNSCFAVSLIKLKHPEGKVWESMFVPINNTASRGLSITRWGKNNKVKGQIQIKMLSEPDWYKMVSTKYKSGGYDVGCYMGIDTPHSSRHVIVNDVASSPSIPNIPQLAWDRAQVDPIVSASSVVGLGSGMATGIINHRATHNFLAHINTLGHNYGHELGELAKEIASLSNVNNVDKSRLQGIVSTLINHPCGHTGVEYAKSTKVEAVAREEAYSGWGAFG